MRYLTAADIKKVFSMRQAIEADREALSLYSAGRADIPLRTNIDVPEHNGQSLYMPGYVSSSQPALGIKIVSVYPDNPQKDLPSVPATMITLDATTGVVNAVLDGTYLTQLRTGAIQGLATELLSRSNSSQALLIGTGGQAMSQLLAMLTVRPLKKIYIYDLDQKRATDFAQQAAKKFSRQFAAEFLPIADPDQVVAQVDIITTVTTSHRATFDGQLVKSGTHINGIGAYTPDMCEMPTEVLQKADCIIFDTMDGVLAEAGDIIQPVEKRQLSKNNFTGELGQLINKKILGRTSQNQITVFKTVGTAAVDVVAADRIVKAAQQAKVGTILN
ncbi:ornithine cyclodeaminase family protein [Liquorilactobacillus sicerae]|uniref:ornithine cyclodeaminase family protein n=1 Tax=Liquorilactobacillus sicerae TaxID=1416943 RepID=UPI00248099BC|nr:ornithine cyclodeaminase family protein [Liquorilactobacillus sicerae]